ncbi:MAG: diguanylate cyclase [Anaerolineaceae bacterium]|nr:diguanylate cyclase [Anaerolineaceae bacterium]
MHSIRVKVAFVTITAILVSMLSLGLIGVYTLRVESDRSSVEKLNLMSENAGKTLDAYLNSLQQSVEMALHLANDSTKKLDPEIVTKAAESPEQMKNLDAFLAEHAALIQQSYSSIANNTSGVETYYYCINSDLGSSEHGFFYSKVGRENYEEQPPLNSHDLDPEDIEHTTWYYSPIQHGGPLWIGPYRAHYLNEVWTVSYVTPVYKDHILLGVLGMDILFDTMIAQISSIKVYETGCVFLLDSEGLVLYHPKYEMGTIPTDVSESLNEDLLRQDSSGDQMIRFKGASGKEKQIAFTTLSNGMMLAISVPVEEIMASQRQLTKVFIAVAGVMVVLFLVVILLWVNRITKPLLELAAASQKMADGDYDVSLDYTEDDEVGVLTNSFKQMRYRLQSFINDLNSKAYQDALTGIKNKGAFLISAERLNEAIRMGKDGNMPEFAAVVFDCNKLKEINDEFGHAMGDIYLRTASSAICKVYSHSPVFRLGGDEFGVLLQNQDYANRDRLLFDFDSLADQINSAAEHPWEKVDLSKGMAVFDPANHLSVNDVMDAADAQMYINKKSVRRN